MGFGFRSYFFFFESLIEEFLVYFSRNDVCNFSDSGFKFIIEFFFSIFFFVQVEVIFVGVVFVLAIFNIKDVNFKFIVLFFFFQGLFQVFVGIVVDEQVEFRSDVFCFRCIVIQFGYFQFYYVVILYGVFYSFVFVGVFVGSLQVFIYYFFIWFYDYFFESCVFVCILYFKIWCEAEVKFENVVLKGFQVKVLWFLIS